MGTGVLKRRVRHPLHGPRPLVGRRRTKSTAFRPRNETRNPIVEGTRRTERRNLPQAALVSLNVTAGTVLQGSPGFTHRVNFIPSLPIKRQQPTSPPSRYTNIRPCFHNKHGVRARFLPLSFFFPPGFICFPFSCALYDNRSLICPDVFATASDAPLPSPSPLTLEDRPRNTQPPTTTARPRPDLPPFLLVSVCSSVISQSNYAQIPAKFTYIPEPKQTDVGFAQWKFVLPASFFDLN